MSSFDRAPGRRFRLGAIVLLVSGLLAACTVQPVYGPKPGGGAVTSTLRGVDIDPVNDRVGQVVRNKLVGGFAQGGATDPVYRMHLNVTVSETALGIGATGASPTNSVAVTVTYDLKRISDGSLIERKSARSAASYDRVNSAFANDRAKLDAQNRAAETVAGEILIKVAAAIANRG